MNFIPQEFHYYLPHALAGLAIFSFISLLSLLLLYLRIRDYRSNLKELKNMLRSREQENAELTELTTSMKVRMAKLTTLIKGERKSGEEKLAMLEGAKENLKLQFEALAQKIFEEKSERFNHDNKERVSALLLPLQEQLQSFQNRIDAVQADEIRERTSLKNEILHLRELNQQINREAVNLTRALKGDKKIQGNWGEMVLEKVIENSGLRRGMEYSVQKGYRDRENRLLKPDVVVHLPGNRDIIIDSKVSLTAWEKYISCDEEETRKALLKEHIQNLRNHVAGLGSKGYSEINGLHSLDFILLFIPIDASFTAACEVDEKLFGDAYGQKIIIVTPTTLLATLKTIENLWRYEHQNRNAKEIADRASAIYEKLCSFMEEIEKIGRQLSTCTATYESAVSKLGKGRGNLISQTVKLKELGILSKKDIPRSLQHTADDVHPN